MEGNMQFYQSENYDEFLDIEEDLSHLLRGKDYFVGENEIWLRLAEIHYWLNNVLLKMETEGYEMTSYDKYHMKMLIDTYRALKQRAIEEQRMETESPLITSQEIELKSIQFFEAAKIIEKLCKQVARKQLLEGEMVGSC
jgi:hypothetical protein